MAKLRLGGRDFDIAPYKLGALRKAAPYIDRINASVQQLKTMEGMTQSQTDLAAVLSIGLVKIDPTLTPEGLDDIIGIDDLPAMLQAFTDLMAGSGLAQGEAPAPVPQEGAGA